jgi:hypothetical protein
MIQELRQCVREPIPEIAEAAALLEEAVTAHLAGHSKIASDLILRCDMPAIRDWTESLWGASSPYVKVRKIHPPVPHLPKAERVPVRMPSASEKTRLLKNNGYHCRFCGIPVIRMEIRKRIKEAYPEALSWGSTNQTQHAAFQAMWVQYDHLLPHARGGNNDLDNVIITCAPRNYARMHYTIEEVGLMDPRSRLPVKSSWQGLEQFH